jgi:GT2 family glycosyltransferase
MNRDCTIAAFLGVRDEVEFIEQSILHLRAIGVDKIIVCDMSSTDGTLEILEKYRSDYLSFFSLKNATEADHLEEEEEWAVEAWKRYSLAPCDWVIFLDADEFWLPASGNLKDCAGFYSADLLVVDRYNVVLGKNGPLMPLDLKPAAYGRVDLYAKPVPDFHLAKQAHARSMPWIRGAAEPKIAARRSRMVKLAVGQHDMAMSPGSRREKPEDLLVAHVALSTRSRFERKVANIRSIYAEAGIDLSLPEESWERYGTAWHWRRWATLPDLAKEFEEYAVGDQELAALRRDGEIMSARELLDLRSPRFSDAHLRKGNLLLEFEYEATFRPRDLLDSADDRLIAIRFREFEVVCATTGDNLGRFDFGAKTPDGWQDIYGLARFEPDFRWSLGPRSALFLSLDKALLDGIRLTIVHGVNAVWLSRVPARLRVNGGAWRDVEFRGGTLTVDIDLTEGRRAAAGQNLSLVASGAPRLSILVVNHARPDLTFAAVVAVHSAKIAFPYEIIVVDNGSDPSSAARLTGMDLPVRLIGTSEPVSFGTANNLAAEAARGEFLLLLNNDAFLEEGVVEKLLEALSEDGVGLVGPVLRYPDNSLQETGMFVSADGTNVDPLLNGQGWDAPEFVDVDYISAACVMLRRADFLGVGGFDPVFEFAYSEDCDLCLRLRAIGKRTRLVTSASVRHIRSATSARLDLQPRAEAAKRRNMNVMRSRLRQLSAAGETDASVSHTFDVSRLEDGIARFPDRAVLNGVIPEGPLSSSSDADSLLAHTAALGRLRPTIVVEDSVLDVRQRVGALGLPHETLAAGGRSELERRAWDVLLVSGGMFPPTVMPSWGAKRILHCPVPARLGDDDLEAARRHLGNLLNFDAIVTDSAFGARACTALLDRLGAPPVDVEVIHGPVDVFPRETGERRDIIVSMGPLRRGPSGGAHDAVLRGFSRFQSVQKGRRWRLVIVGTLSLDDDHTYVDQLRRLQPQLDVDVMVSPPRAVLRRLLLRSKIHVSARGLDATSTEDDPAAFTSSISRVGTAISAGCVPVVFHIGAEAEFLAVHGLGQRFGDEVELTAALIEAAAVADAGGLSEAQRASMDDYSPSAHAKAWAHLVSRLDRDIESAAGRPPALIVAGCHCSETSAVARILSLAGADLPADLMVPAADSPTGLWEPGAIASFNEALLVSRGSSWHDPFARHRIGTTDEADIHKAYGLIEASFPGDRPIILQDPRISILTDLWDAAARSARHPPKYIILVRDPREVAASLSRMSGHSMGKVLLIWAASMRAVEKGTRKGERLFVAYEDLISQPLVTLDRIAKALRVAFPRRAGAATRFSALLHAPRRQEIPAVAGDHLTAAIDDYFQALRAACRDEPLAEAPGETLEAWLADFASLFGPAFLDGGE